MYVSLVTKYEYKIMNDRKLLLLLSTEIYIFYLNVFLDIFSSFKIKIVCYYHRILCMICMIWMNDAYHWFSIKKGKLLFHDCVYSKIPIIVLCLHFISNNATLMYMQYINWNVLDICLWAIHELKQIQYLLMSIQWSKISI